MKTSSDLRVWSGIDSVYNIQTVISLYIPTFFINVGHCFYWQRPFYNAMALSLAFSVSSSASIPNWSFPVSLHLIGDLANCVESFLPNLNYFLSFLQLAPPPAVHMHSCSR